MSTQGEGCAQVSERRVRGGGWGVITCSSVSVVRRGSMRAPAPDASSRAPIPRNPLAVSDASPLPCTPRRIAHDDGRAAPSATPSRVSESGGSARRIISGVVAGGTTDVTSVAPPPPPPPPPPCLPLVPPAAASVVAAAAAASMWSLDESAGVPSGLSSRPVSSLTSCKPASETRSRSVAGMPPSSVSLPMTSRMIASTIPSRIHHGRRVVRSTAFSSSLRIARIASGPLGSWSKAASRSSSKKSMKSSHSARDVVSVTSPRSASTDGGVPAAAASPSGSSSVSCRPSFMPGHGAPRAREWESRPSPLLLKLDGADDDASSATAEAEAAGGADDDGASGSRRGADSSALAAAALSLSLSLSRPLLGRKSECSFSSQKPCFSPPDDEDADAPSAAALRARGTALLRSGIAPPSAASVGAPATSPASRSQWHATPVAPTLETRRRSLRPDPPPGSTRSGRLRPRAAPGFGQSAVWSRGWSAKWALFSPWRCAVRARDIAQPDVEPQTPLGLHPRARRQRRDVQRDLRPRRVARGDASRRVEQLHRRACTHGQMRRNAGQHWPRAAPRLQTQPEGLMVASCGQGGSDGGQLWPRRL